MTNRFVVQLLQTAPANYEHAGATAAFIQKALNHPDYKHHCLEGVFSLLSGQTLVVWRSVDGAAATDTEG